MIKRKLNFEPHPLRVLIKCTKQSFEEIFYKWITRDDGTKVQLFSSVESQEGFDNRFTQNVSAGMIVAVGMAVENIFNSDIAILDYLVYNDNDALIGFVNGDRMVSLPAKTTYHDTDAPPSINMRKAYIKGDYDEVSKILGVIRNDKLLSFSPYVFLEHKENKIMKVNAFGLINEEVEYIAIREVLSAPESSGYKDGDKIFLKEEDLFFRNISGKMISVCFEKDILGKK